MTHLEYEYQEGRKAFLSCKPFSTSKSISWQNGWIDAYNSKLELQVLL